MGQRQSEAFSGGLRRARREVRNYLQGQILFTQDLYAGAAPAHRIRVRLVTTNAWHALFARNMFIRPAAAELESFVPDYVILHAPDLSGRSSALWAALVRPRSLCPLPKS